MFDAELLFAELRDAHLDKDEILRAVEACRHYVMVHGKRHPAGIRATDLVNACDRYMRPLDAHDRQRVYVWLIKQPLLASKLHCAARGVQHTLRFWRADCAPEGAFCMGRRQMLELA